MKNPPQAVLLEPWTASPWLKRLIRFEHTSVRPIIGSPEIPPDLSNHLSNTLETSVKWPLPHWHSVLSCAGDKGQFSVFTSSLHKVNDKYVHRGLRFTQPKRPSQPLTSQVNRQRLLKNAPRQAFSYFFFYLLCLCFAVHLPSSIS